MEILFVASEVAPFSKTGGLGDVAGALPRALADRGHAISVVTPRYGSIDPAAHGLHLLHRSVRVRGEPTTILVNRDKAPVYFVEHERLFGSRKGLYGDGTHDYVDNAERFAYLCRAALALPGALGLRPRIVHLNDWQTGLAPFLLRQEHAHDPALLGAKTVYTVHNLAYQGVFPKEVVPDLGLPWGAFRYEEMEFHDRLSFMKAGLVFADALTTVSPTYANEILHPEAGDGLDSLLRHRKKDLTGILNGIDTQAWDPRHDRHLVATYSPEDLSGKAEGKAALQRELSLPVAPNVPLLVLITRIADQKGLDLVLLALPELLSREVQVALLGSGRAEWENAFQAAAKASPHKMAVRIGFDEGLAHRMEAGGDLFLMPSRFEPCGLNQMYSLRYGTVPVVRAVGGLEDTVEDYDGALRGTGFKFRDYTPQALMLAVRRGLETFRDKRAWRGLVLRGMATDLSWAKSAESYEDLYRRLLSA